MGEGNGNQILCSCLENPRYGGAWWAAVYGVAQSRIQLKWFSSSSSSSSSRHFVELAFSYRLLICWLSHLSRMKLEWTSVHVSIAQVWEKSKLFSDSITEKCASRYGQWIEDSQRFPNAQHVLSCAVHAQWCPTLWLHGLYPTRLVHSWDFPSKNTGVGWRLLLQRNLPDPRIKPVSPVSPTLAGRLFTTELPGKPMC